MTTESWEFQFPGRVTAPGWSSFGVLWKPGGGNPKQLLDCPTGRRGLKVDLSIRGGSRSLGLWPVLQGSRPGAHLEYHLTRGATRERRALGVPLCPVSFCVQCPAFSRLHFRSLCACSSSGLLVSFPWLEPLSDLALPRPCGRCDPRHLLSSPRPPVPPLRVFGSQPAVVLCSTVGGPSEPPLKLLLVLGGLF